MRWSEVLARNLVVTRAGVDSRADFGGRVIALMEGHWNDVRDEQTHPLRWLLESSICGARRKS
ncbi:hypothetical protein F383_23326 [Gossypium arboreum]|uniref:Uncharacterized protein n=1 Tax=Gossypium arboreum TaxID=29729 RepID=A0A0B0NWC5_GOSAR|nr:hypothetical protein F383_23326 [Gossypium arboreum]